MYSVEKMFGLSLPKIEFMGTGYSDYDDFIFAEKSEECIKMFIDYLNCIPEKWYCIDLNEIPENTETVALLNKMSRYS